MVRVAVTCPYCQSDYIVKRGKTDTDKQRYSCQNPNCSHQSFLLKPAYKGLLPEIKEHLLLAIRPINFKYCEFQVVSRESSPIRGGTRYSAVLLREALANDPSLCPLYLSGS